MAITREIFEQQCKRRFGGANPEPMRLAHWESMVRRGGSPYGVRKDLGLEPNYGCCTPEGCSLRSDPDWCFDRVGMSRTTMPDGRVVCIAGEHEDFYDPDFCIYNDVIVLRPAPGEAGVTPESGEVEIYGYPEAVFPPTDFHSATPVDGRIFLIGRLGYSGTRMEGTTPVLALDTVTYRIEQVSTTGPCPGWVYKHHASYDSARHAITVRGGNIHFERAENETPRLAAHRLHLADLRWELIAHQETHRRFLMEKVKDDSCAVSEPTPDAFRPASVPHHALMSEDRGVSVHGIDVQGVRVTFEVWWNEVRALVEGDLPTEVIRRTLKDVAENLRRSTGSEWSLQELQPFGDD